MSRKLITNFLITLSLITFYAASYNALLQHRASSQHAPRHQTSVFCSLPPVALLAVAGEFKGLMSDYLTLEAGAQLGAEVIRTPAGGYKIVKKQYDWSAIHQLFVASQVLDPSFAQTYMLAQGWLPWDANMLPETQKILRIAANNRPWDWQPLHSMGFNAYYFLNQPGTAGKLFLEAAKTPNAPPFLPILGARLAQKGGETETAIIIMKSMLAGKNPEEPGYTDMVDRLRALEGVRVIERAANSYEKAQGRKPSSLAELTASGLLAALPPNPYNIDYCMDTAGVIYFDRPNCRDAAPGRSSQ